MGIREGTGSTPPTLSRVVTIPGYVPTKDIGPSIFWPYIPPAYINPSYTVPAYMGHIHNRTLVLTTAQTSEATHPSTTMNMIPNDSIFSTLLEFFSVFALHQFLALKVS